jgi:hypothetical protein
MKGTDALDTGGRHLAPGREKVDSHCTVYESRLASRPIDEHHHEWAISSAGWSVGNAAPMVSEDIAVNTGLFPADVCPRTV